jgi:hypothetical protein
LGVSDSSIAIAAQEVILKGKDTIANRTRRSTMFIKQRATGKLVEVLSMRDLFNPMHATLIGRFHAGEEVQEPEELAKADLVFCSGEDLPKCWTDVHYRDEEAHHRYRLHP